jgi:hypothetical protein
VQVEHHLVLCKQIKDAVGADLQVVGLACCTALVFPPAGAF